MLLTGHVVAPYNLLSCQIMLFERAMTPALVKVGYELDVSGTFGPSVILHASIALSTVFDLILREQLPFIDGETALNSRSMAAT